MTRITLTVACLLAVLSLDACKIVKTKPADTNAVASDATGDDARIAALVADTWDAKLLPHVTSTATDIGTLRKAVADGLDAAGKTHGHRGAGEGGAWSFAATGTGIVVSENRKSRAAKIELDTDADGAADTTLQLGPVIKGTALRDLAPFFQFTDFRDQIEFAKLGRALNDRAAAAITLPEGDLIGKTIHFTGAFAMHSAKDPVQVVPIAIEVAP